VPKKEELIATLKEQALAAQQAQGTVAGSNAPPVTMGGGGAGAPGGPVAGGELDTLKRVQNMPEGIQEKWNDLPSKVQHAVMKSGAGDMQI
jgi:hypothetical protein